MGRDDKHGAETAPVDFQEPVTLAWESRGGRKDPELAAWAWELVRRTLRLDSEPRAVAAGPAGADPAER